MLYPRVWGGVCNKKGGGIFITFLKSMISSARTHTLVLFTYDVISPPAHLNMHPLLGNRVTYPAEHILLSLVHFLPPQYTRHYIFTHLKWTYPNLCYIITWLGIRLLLTDSCSSSKGLDRGISISVYLFEQYYKIIIQPVINLFIHVATHLGPVS